jgi:hypothetical protein
MSTESEDIAAVCQQVTTGKDTACFSELQSVWISNCAMPMPMLSGVGFPKYCDHYVVYCMSPIEFQISHHTLSALVLCLPHLPENNGTYLLAPFWRNWKLCLDGKWPIILLRGPLGAWGSLTCSKFTTWVKQLKVPPGGLVPWIFPSLRIRRPPPGLNPRHSSHEVGTLPLDYGGHFTIVL